MYVCVAKAPRPVDIFEPNLAWMLNAHCATSGKLRKFRIIPPNPPNYLRFPDFPSIFWVIRVLITFVIEWILCFAANYTYIFCLKIIAMQLKRLRFLWLIKDPRASYLLARSLKRIMIFSVFKELLRILRLHEMISIRGFAAFEFLRESVWSLQLRLPPIHCITNSDVSMTQNNENIA